MWEVMGGVLGRRDKGTVASLGGFKLEPLLLSDSHRMTEDWASRRCLSKLLLSHPSIENSKESDTKV